MERAILMRVNVPAYFVFISDYTRHCEEEITGGFQQIDTEEYLMTQHTCPINYADEVVMIIQDGDSDPHGVFEYLGSVPVADYQKVRLIDRATPLEDLKKLFPPLGEEVERD